MNAIPIIALDVGSAPEALALVERLGESCNFYKVGSELFTAEGPPIVMALRARGLEVFLDLKFHDIPNTVAGAVRSAVHAGATMLTVHASGGARMLGAAAESAERTGGCRVMGVTILTSLDSAAIGASWGRTEPVSVEEEVLRLAGQCAAAGLHGIVCSGHEARGVVARYGAALQPLVPGIRFSDGDTQDQARVMSPSSAARAGARYLVIGRPVTEASDPAEAMARVHAELAGIAPPVA
jgi:orotidine-5'-phosphate decarboxylase